MSPLLGADGRPIVQEAGGTSRCVVCCLLDDEPVDKQDPVLIAYEDGIVHGFAVGLHLLATIIVGSGVGPEQAAHLQTVAARLCDEHKRLADVFCEADKHRAPVERAVDNIRAASTFLVGRGPSGEVKGMGP
jgi:hypothetical protein